MTLRKQIKYNSKRCLCNNWGKAVSITLLSTAIYLLFVIIEMIANFLLQIPIGTTGLIPGISTAGFFPFCSASLWQSAPFYCLFRLIWESPLGIIRCPKAFRRIF